MRLPTLNAVALALLLIGVTGMVVPTTADTGDHVWDDPAIVLAPSSGPNGQYAQLDANGNLTVNVSGANVEAITDIEDVFTITNEEGDQYAVWVSHDGNDSVSFFVGDNRTLEDSGDPIVLDPNETRAVGFRIDGQGHAAGETLMTTLTLHAERVSSTTPTSAPTGSGSSGGAAATTPVPTSTTPTPTPTRSLEGAVQVEFLVRAEDGDPGTTRFEPASSGEVTVRRLAVSELSIEDQLSEPTPVINHSYRGPVEVGTECPCDLDPSARATGADAVTTVGEPIYLSGSRSRVGHASAVDTDSRILMLVDVEVPRERRDQPGRIRLTLPRGEFGNADPRQAVVTRRTSDGWQILDTRVARLADGNVTLESRTPGFTTFAVFASTDVRYEWTLPDNSTVTGRQLETQFDEPGRYNVTLTVSDAVGRSRSAEYHVIANDRPTVEIEGLENATAGEATTLRANVTNEMGNVTVTWTFPDGSTAVGQTVTRELTVGQTVRVSAVDEFGLEGEDADVVGAPAEVSSQPLFPSGPSIRTLGSQFAIVGGLLIFLITALRWFIDRRRRLPGRANRSVRRG